MITQREKELLTEWLSMNLQMTSKSNVELIVTHVDRYFSSPSAEVKEQQGVDVDKAGVIALKILENVTPKLTDQEQAIFIAGFQECMKWINNQ